VLRRIFGPKKEAVIKGRGSIMKFEIAGQVAYIQNFG
jgi:hypothetical protein